jgi:hypothetical protein
MAGERTCINEADQLYVEYYQGCIVLEGNWTHGCVYLDETSLANFDLWRKELDADIALRKAAGF